MVVNVKRIMKYCLSYTLVLSSLQGFMLKGKPVIRLIISLIHLNAVVAYILRAPTKSIGGVTISPILRY